MWRFGTGLQHSKKPKFLYTNICMIWKTKPKRVPLLGSYIYDINIEYPFYSGAATLLLGFLVSFIGFRS